MNPALHETDPQIQIECTTGLARLLLQAAFDAEVHPKGKPAPQQV